eukprot:4743298-Pyramimonas_sp.AAC.1
MSRRRRPHRQSVGRRAGRGPPRKFRRPQGLVVGAPAHGSELPHEPHETGVREQPAEVHRGTRPLRDQGGLLPAHKARHPQE